MEYPSQSVKPGGFEIAPGSGPLPGAGERTQLTCRQRRRLCRKRRASPPACRRRRRLCRKQWAFPPACRQRRRLYRRQQIFHSNQLSLKVPFFITSISFSEHFLFLDFIVTSGNGEKSTHKSITKSPFCDLSHSLAQTGILYYNRV